MSTLKDRLTADMRAALKARDELTTSTLRMALAAVGNAEVAGREKRELSDDEVLAVLTKEAKKRREAAVAFADAGRAEQAGKETAEGEVLERYLPKQLSDDELAELVSGALAAGGFTGKAQMGPAMKAAQGAVAGRAEGGRVAAEVRRQLGLCPRRSGSAEMTTATSRGRWPSLLSAVSSAVVPAGRRYPVRPGHPAGPAWRCRPAPGCPGRS